MTTFYILIRKIKIQDANAISSPITYGFPSVGGFVGAMHALERKLPSDIPLKFKGVLIASRSCNPKIYRENKYSDFSFILTRNPYTKEGEPAPTIVEGKVDLTLDLVYKASTETEHKIKANKDNIEKTLKTLLMKQRIAGGSVMNIGAIKIFNESGKELYKENSEYSLVDYLLPAYVLVEKKEELPNIVEDLRSKVQANGEPINPNANTLDAIISTARIFEIPISKNENTTTEAEDKVLTEEDSNKQKTEYYSVKTGRGWIVPIPIGYQAIAPEIKAGELKNSRNPEYNASFVESIYSLGEWVFSNSLKKIDPVFGEEDWQKHFWYYKEPQDDGNIIYLYTTGKNKYIIEDFNPD